MNRRVDNIMHKNTYNTSVNKKLNLQEDIEKLEEQQTILTGMVKEVSEENDSLQEKHRELLMKQAVGYDGWEEDLAGFEKELDNIVSTLNRLCEQKTLYSEFTRDVYSGCVWEDIEEVNRCDELIQELCVNYPRISVSSEDLIGRGGRFSRPLGEVVEKLNDKVVKLDDKIRQTEELEGKYKERLAGERSTGKWYFLAGCLVATTITLLLK